MFINLWNACQKHKYMSLKQGSKIQAKLKLKQKLKEGSKSWSKGDLVQAEQLMARDKSEI